MNTVDSNSSLSRRGSKSKRATSIYKVPAYYQKYVTWQQLYVEMAIVFDNSMYNKYNRDVELLQARAKRLVSLVSSLYQPLNIKVALTSVVVWSDRDFITLTNSGDSSLEQFHRYRKYYMKDDLANDNAQLITNMPFEAGIVGKAIKGGMCSTDLSDAVINDHSARDTAVAATMAHEMGHTFGMEHDDSNCECPADRCIMAASSGSREPLYWSSCSLEYLSWSLSHGSDFCLKDKPTRLFSSSTEPLCGNGFLENGEKCDCGKPEVCSNSCCDPKTCQFARNGTCSNGECCDLDTCQLKPVTSPCRAEANECDLVESCDGKSEFCPQDTFKQNGTPCDQNKAYCYGGECGSREKQCKLLWGSTGAQADKYCNIANSRGDRGGNCGPVALSHNESYVPCLGDDVECGMLYCKHKNEKTEFGDRSVVRTTHFQIPVGGDVLLCHGAMVDLYSRGKQDQGYVPSGVPCATKIAAQPKMCAKQKCVLVSEVLNVKKCPNDCNGYGVCNNLGHCHCQFGFGGVDCGIPGHGGSIDSGPPPNPSRFNVTTAVFVCLFVVLPVIIIAVTLLYRRRNMLKNIPCLKSLHRLTLRSRKSSRPPRPLQPPVAKSTSQHGEIATRSTANNNNFKNDATDLKTAAKSMKFSVPTSWDDEAPSIPHAGSVGPPHRPKRPDVQTLRQLFAETPELAANRNGTASAAHLATIHQSPAVKTTSGSLLDQVLTAGRMENFVGATKDLSLVPQRKAPAPPSSNLVDKKPLKRVTSDRTSNRIVRPKTISHPVNPIICGEPTTQAPSLTVVSTVTPTKPIFSLKRAQTNSMTPHSSISRGRGQLLNANSPKITASNSIGRPALAPPPPPAFKKNASTKGGAESNENYYDVLNEPMKNELRMEEDDVYADIEEFRKTPPPALPKAKKISTLAAIFDKK